MPTRKPNKTTFLLATAAWLTAFAVGGYLHGREDMLTRAATDLTDQLRLEQVFLQSRLQTLQILPVVVSGIPCVASYLDDPGGWCRDRLNPTLLEIASRTGVDSIYVMDEKGRVVASSNWQQPDSFVGHDFSFRPYFLGALAGGPSSYTAKGSVSKALGYYLAAPVRIDGVIRGALAVKVAFSRLSEDWMRERGDSAMISLITDEQGVVLMSTEADWRLTRLDGEAPLPPKQYGDAQLPPTPLAQGEALSHGLTQVQAKGDDFLAMQRPAPASPWRILVAARSADYRPILFWSLLQATGIGLLLLVVGYTLVQRWLYKNALVETALRDPLTGLYTRFYMNEAVEAMVRAHSRGQEFGFTLALFDVDHFKRVNDEYGHLVGDSVLRGIGMIFLRESRAGDIPVRLGGEELALFIRCDLTHAMTIAERIRRVVSNTSFIDGQVTISAGVASHRPNESLSHLIERADTALYRAKHSGRNQVVSAEEGEAAID